MARPCKPPEEKYRTPARQAGRISDDDWALIKRALSIKECVIRDVLLRWAKRVIREENSR